MAATTPGKRARTDAMVPPPAGGPSGDGADPEGDSKSLTAQDAAAVTDAGGLPPAVTAAIETEAGEPLPDAAQWSKQMQVDLSGARVVSGPKAARAAASIQAAAFTVGHRVFLGAGVGPGDHEIMRHELTHVAQQRGASMPAARELKLTAPSDHVEHEARGEAAGAHIAPTGNAVIAPIGLFGRMGPGGGGGILPGPKNPQIDAFHYFEKHGKAHFKELMDMKMGDMSLDTGSPYAAWAAGNAKGFLDKLSYDLFANATAKPYDLAEKTLVPASVSQLIDTGRDAANPDDPEKANEYHLGVTLELQKAYRERLRDALKRLMPRLIKEWNRRTLADQAERQKGATVAIPEHPETNQPGVGILQSHPIDRFVLGALWSLTTPTLKPDFAAYRKAFPEEGKSSGPRDAKPVVDTLRKVKFEWQSPNQARHWIKVTDPINATPEEVAQELFGDTQLTYLVTPAAPLFGLDTRLHMLRPEYEKQHSKFYDDKSPGGDVAHEMLAGKQGSDAALNQASAFTTAKASKPAVLQQFDLAIDELRKIAANAASWITFDKDVQEALARTEKRKQTIADSSDTKESDRWNAQIREQLDITAKCDAGLGIISKLYRSLEAPEPRTLAHQIGTLFVTAAGHSDAAITARAELDKANQRLLAFPADWVEAQFRWIHRAIIASQKNAKSGHEDPFVKSLGDKETKLRLDLMKVRDQLLTNPLSVQPQLDKITKDLQELATGAAAIRNMDLCDEAFVQLKDAKSATGWIRSLASNPVTGSHGNDRLDALAGSAEKFQGEWNAILKKWRDGDKQGAANDLESKSKTDEWKQFFNAVAKEMKDQARYDAWMTFGILVGIAIVTGFAGVLIEPLAAAAVGPLLGFAVTVTTEAAMFTTMSYFLVEKHPTGAGFRSELGKNVLIFGALKGLSKAFAGLEKVLEIELKEAEVISQFAAVNGIALYQANQEKAKHGETLSEADIMKISFDNLVFMIAVAIGGKALAPMFGKWRVKVEVGKGLKEIEALHAEVTALGEQAKASKDKAVGQKLLDKQRELLTAEREYLEALLELTTKGREAALKKGMTAQQYDALMGASKDLSSAVRGLHEAELMGKLEPVTKGQYLCEPGKTFDEAIEHYGGDKTNKLGKVVTDPTTKTRSFEVQLPDSSTLRISERAGKVGEVNTETKPTATSGGEPAAPRGEEVARAHGLTEPAAVQAFEALYKAHPKQVLELLDALKGEPGLANKLLAKFGESALSHLKPTGDGRLSIHGEIDIAPSKLRALSDADIAKLVEVAKHKGPVADFEYFESTSENDGKPGARLRFKSRVRDRVMKMTTEIKNALKLDAADKRAEIFEADKMSEADAIRLWDLFNERAYKNADVRQQAADWAFSKNPKSAREFVAEMQFYDAEVSKLADKYEGEARTELAKQLAARKSAKGRDLTDAEVTEATRAATKAKLGRALDIDGPAWTRQANKRAIDEMAQEVTKDGKQSTVGRDAADAGWKTNIDAQKSDPAGTKGIRGEKTDLELPNHLKTIADTLQFATDYDAAYHAHKHASELPSRPPAATEMVEYLKAARNFVRTKNGITRANQNGSRSVVYEADGMRAIVQVSADGNAALSTFGKAN